MDIIYFVKNTRHNEELKYSLRSVEKHLPGNVWFCGGNPAGLYPDKIIPFAQYNGNKWFNVSKMIQYVCRLNSLEDFYLMNDDFFLLEDWSGENYYDGTLEELVERIIEKTGRPSVYTEQRLKKAIDFLKEKGLPTNNFELHCPMKINRQKMLAMLKEFGDVPCKRSLYGNLYGGVPGKDNKIVGLEEEYLGGAFVSTGDASFKVGKIGQFIRSQFPERSRFERQTYKPHTVQ